MELTYNCLELSATNNIMKLLQYLIIFLASGYFLSIFSSCTPSEPEIIDLGLNYYPLEIGKYRVYKVDSVIYDFVNNMKKIDTISFYLKEELTDTIRDNQGNLVYTLERLERFDQNDIWRVKDVYGVSLIEYQLHAVEENQRFIKLVFPVGVDVAPWNGNTFIDEFTTVDIAGESIEIFKGWLYEYSEVDEPLVVQNIPFDSTLTVIQASEDNLIEGRFSTEIYARGVGLIKKDMQILNTQCYNCVGDPWPVKAEKGFILKQEIIEHN